MKRYLAVWISVAALLIALGGNFALYLTTSETRSALCSFKSDLERRVSSSQAFLDHPETIPALNNPETIAQVRTSLRNQRATLGALKDLNC